MSVDRLDQAWLDAEWDFADGAASAQRFVRALAENLLGPSARAEVSTQLARALGLQGAFEPAHQELDQLVATAPTAGFQPVVEIRILLERGRLLNSSGSPSEASPYFRWAMDLAEKQGEIFLAVDAAHMLAIAEPTQAAMWTDRALALLAASNDARTRRWAGSLHNNRGWALMDAGDAQGALQAFEGALAAYSDNGTEEQIRIARWSIGRALRSLGRWYEALIIQRHLAEDGPADGYVEEEIGELLLCLGRSDVAASHFELAHRLLSHDLDFAERETDRLNRLRTLAGIADIERHRQDPGQPPTPERT